MEERSLISYVWSYSWRRLRWKKNEGVSIIYSRWWFVMFLPCEVNSLNQDLLHRCSIVLLRLCFVCPEWESAVTRDWSFSVLRVWFLSLAGSPHLLKSNPDWADNIRTNAGQRFCGDLNTEGILAEDEPNQTSAQIRNSPSIWRRLHPFSFFLFFCFLSLV